MLKESKTKEEKNKYKEEKKIEKELHYQQCC